MAGDLDTSKKSKAPSGGLLITQEIPLAPVSPTITCIVIPPGADAVVQTIWKYLYSAWFTVEIGWASKRRIRQQWWYFQRKSGGNWEPFAPFYWLGDYAPGPENDDKFRILADALTLACARMTGGLYRGDDLPSLTMVPTAKPCTKGTFDCTVYFAELHMCSGWWSSYSAHEREISLMAALLTGFEEVRNRGNSLVAGSGDTELSPEQDAALIVNAYNIAEWAKARFQKFGMRTAPDPSPMPAFKKICWDLRPDKSWKPIFPARLSGGGSDRPYSVGGGDVDHPLIKRAWDESWCQIESGMRFLFKLSYMSKEQIRDMWNFGTWMNPEERGHFFSGDDRLLEKGYCMFRKIERSVPAGDWVGLGDHAPSMRTWFGEFNHQRFLLVFRVMLCRTLRGEGRYKRWGWDDLVEHFRVYAKKNPSDYDTLALSHLDGSTDLWAHFFEVEDWQRRITMTHELMHYMIKVEDGGRPRDHKSGTHCSGDAGLNICYDQWECRNLAQADSSMARSNINNYVWWLHYRWARWGSDWPPHCDRGAGEIWHGDPISDLDWDDHHYDSVGDVGWSRLDALERLFGEEGYMPWG